MGQPFVYNSGKDEFKKEEIQLEFAIFIDGTLNNKNNTDWRTEYGRGVDSEGNVDYAKSNKKIEEDDIKEKDEFLK